MSTRTSTRCAIVESGVVADVADVMRHSKCLGKAPSYMFQRGVCAMKEWEVRMSGAGEEVSKWDEWDGPHTAHL